MGRKSLNEFIEEANIVHNNKYDYSLVEYINNKTKVKIICPEHGIFAQTPKNHLHNRGCKKCGIRKRTEFKTKTLETFIKQASKKHDNKYDYSLVEYINNKTKIKIICPIHGTFEQRPDAHLSGKGCIKCQHNYIKSIKSFTKEKFITTAKQIHGSKYNYSLVSYINANTKVKIICPEHGIFEQIPPAHLNGAGCDKCYRLKSRIDTKKFIKKAKLIHSNKYNYSLSKYTIGREKIKIICPIHGVFEQIARNHIYGDTGCPVCNESKGEKAIAHYLDNKNIQYIRQKRFNDCKNILPLPFDFYIHDKLLIEYDGKQHYEPIDFFGGEEGFKYIQQNDKIKNQYCLDNNIKLIRIKYNENIKDVLKKELII